MTIKDVMILAACILVCFGAAAAGSAATFSSIPTWYAGLTKPPLNPPNQVFGPVWTILYLMMGISIYLIIKNGFAGGIVRLAAVLFVCQLIFNVAWSVTFFGARQPLAAFLVIIILWALIFSCIVYFGNISKPAAWLLVPYLLWVTFASYLNAGVWWLNK